MALSATRTAARPDTRLRHARPACTEFVRSCKAAMRGFAKAGISVLPGKDPYIRVGRDFRPWIGTIDIQAALSERDRNVYRTFDAETSANRPDRTGSERAGRAPAVSDRKHFCRRFCTLTAALLAAVLSTSGCITPHDSFATDVDAAAWTLPAEIVYPNADTVGRRRMGLFLRCDNRFAEDTLTVRIAVLTPDSLRFEEPFTLTVPADDTPAALMRIAEIPYRSNVRFACTGGYRIRITPTRPVRGVEAVGIDLSPTVPVPQ